MQMFIICIYICNSVAFRGSEMRVGICGAAQQAAEVLLSRMVSGDMFGSEHVRQSFLSKFNFDTKITALCASVRILCQFMNNLLCFLEIIMRSNVRF